MVCVLTFALPSCGSGMTGEDRSRLEALNRQYGTHFIFEIEEPLYVKAISRSGTPDKKTAAAIYEAFWFNEQRPRTDSRYVYLNVYGTKQQFLFQAYFDPASQSVTFGTTEHY